MFILQILFINGSKKHFVLSSSPIVHTTRLGDCVVLEETLGEYGTDEYQTDWCHQYPFDVDGQRLSKELDCEHIVGTHGGKKRYTHDLSSHR